LNGPVALLQQRVDILAREFFRGRHQSAENSRNLAMWGAEKRSAFAKALADAELWRDLPSSDYSESLRELAGMASKTARQEEEGFIGVIGNSQVDGGSS
jgi:hypothetical protein